MEGGGAAGGRAATPFAAEREELPRGKILEELFDGLIDFFHVLQMPLAAVSLIAQVSSSTVDYDSRERRWATIRPNR